MINVRNEIKSIVDSIRSSGNIYDFDEVNGVITVTSDNVRNLEAGFKVVLKYSDSTKNRDVIISTVNIYTNTFTFIGAGIDTPDSWELALYFDYGHRTEIYKKYDNKDKSVNKLVQEYPLIWLYTDFNYDDGDDELIEAKTNLKGAICDFSKIEYYENDRMTNKFIPVIYPIYELFKSAFTEGITSRKFTQFPRPKIDTIDRPFFGSADKNKEVLPQTTDALEWQAELNWFKQSTC